MVAVSKLSYETARWFGDMLPDMRHRGWVSTGAIADITIFDPATVKESSDFELGKNSLPSMGIPYVIVNGVIIAKDWEIVKDLDPGRPIHKAKQR